MEPAGNPGSWRYSIAIVSPVNCRGQSIASFIFFAVLMARITVCDVGCMFCWLMAVCETLSRMMLASWVKHACLGE